MTDTAERPVIVDSQLQYRVEQFLYHEAQLLDEWQYQTWLELFTSDLHYWMPVRHNRMRRQLPENESAARGIEMAHYDDTYQTMAYRVAQRASGLNWAEDPPSRTRHLVSNVRIEASTEEPEALSVRSIFLVYRNRLESEVDIWAGERFDRLRPVQDSFTIARRTVLLDQNVVQSKNLSVFF